MNEATIHCSTVSVDISNASLHRCCDPIRLLLNIASNHHVHCLCRLKGYATGYVV